MVKYTPDSYLIDLEKEGTAGAKKEHSKLGRFRFVAYNQEQLQQDIARGNGEYLRAYFESRSPSGISEEYQAFLKGISREAPVLLMLRDPVEFYGVLEVI